MAKLVAKKYSHALFQLGVEEKKLDVLYEEVKLVLETLKDGELNKVLQHPQIVSHEKMSVIKNSYEGKISDELIGLFELVIRKNRENEIVHIFRFFIEEVENYRGITNAKITSAVPLTDDQISRIVQKIANGRTINVITELNPDLIGGFVIEIGGTVIDGSLKKNIHDMKESLLKIQLA